MRTSKAQQAKSRHQILRAAVKLMTAQGYEDTTLKQVAREAGVGDVTVYNYFASKERLLLGYFEAAVQGAIAQWQATPDEATFTLRERLQLLVDALLAQLAPDRAFVSIARRVLHSTPLLVADAGLPGRAALALAVEQMLSQAEDTGEIVPCGFKGAVGTLMVDFCYGLIAFWLRDESEHAGDTTQLVDHSLDLVVLVLQTGLVNKLLALGGLVLRSQMGRWLDQGPALVQALGLLKAGLKSGRA